MAAATAVIISTLTNFSTKISEAAALVVAGVAVDSILKWDKVPSKSRLAPRPNANTNKSRSEGQASHDEQKSKEITMWFDYNRPNHFNIAALFFR